ncbi:MAG: hypothetical protein AAF378_05365 [Cyanobacteria bacterium P01_A01_bin.84]
MDIQNILKNLTSLDALKSLTLTLISIAIGAFITYKFLFFIFKKEMKLFRNFKRKIFVFDPPTKHDATGSGMEAEFYEIENNALFKSVHRKSGTNIMHTNSINSQCLVVLGIADDFNYFKAVFKRASDTKVPIVIYTYGNSRALEDKH